MRVLVTGAAGYIGSHACKALAASGFEPVGIDNMERAGIASLPWGTLEVADIRDRKALDRVIATHRPAAAMHFAAYAYVGESMLAPDRYYANNVCGSQSLLSALASAGVRHVVFSSTCAVYGMPHACPMDEDHPQVPINPYGAGKQMIERMLRDYEAAYGMRHVALRYFNAAGADPGGMLGECHDPETHAIPLAIQAALGRRPSFDVLGTDYPTPDGTAVRDYVHVSDLATAHVEALQYLLEDNASLALNLGTGRGHSVLEVVRSVERTTGREVPLRRAARRAGDPPMLVADPARAARILGWKPTFTVLDEIVGTAVQWELKRSRDSSAGPASVAPPKRG
jgi:UDP-arabinose 4-epimerase